MLEFYTQYVQDGGDWNSRTTIYPASAMCVVEMQRKCELDTGLESLEEGETLFQFTQRRGNDSSWWRVAVKLDFLDMITW